MVMAEIRETEWQFDAVDLRPVIRWLADLPGQFEGREVRVEPSGSTSQVDVYIDTADNRFRRAGYSVRVRRASRAKDARAEATLKELESKTSGEGGLRSRREVSERLEEADHALLSQSEGPVGRRINAVAGKKKLRPLFEVRTRRRRFSVQVGDLPPGEIALDETAIRPGAGGAATRLHRVEIEVPEAAVSALEPFVEQFRAACRLQPAQLTKYETGVLTVGLEVVPQAFGATTIEADARIGRVALAVLRRQFWALLAREPGTRLGDDPEELHDMRVASRRLRAALSLFADVLPPSAAKLEDDLRWVGHMLGAVRDLDVQLEQLDAWFLQLPEIDHEPLASLRSLLEAKRSDARETMLTAFDSRRYELFVGRFGRLLRSARGRRSGPASMPALAVAPDLIEARFRALQKAADQIEADSRAAAYHRVRIRAKRFRYALEFLAEVYQGRSRPLTRRVVALQDILGLHQDAEVAIERLRELAKEHGDELPPEAIFATGEIAERYRCNALELRAAFPKAYARATGKSWRAFSKLIEAERPERAPSRAPRSSEQAVAISSRETPQPSPRFSRSTVRNVPPDDELPLVG
jgi:CHAD domain-containing protein